MQDIIIKGQWIKRELWILLVCFGIALAMNILGIMIYDTSWHELYTTWYVMIALALFIYFLLAFFRFIIWLIGRKLLKR